MIVSGIGTEGCAPLVICSTTDNYERNNGCDKSIHEVFWPRIEFTWGLLANEGSWFMHQWCTFFMATHKTPSSSFFPLCGNPGMSPDMEHSQHQFLISVMIWNLLCPSPSQWVTYVTLTAKAELSLYPKAKEEGRWQWRQYGWDVIQRRVHWWWQNGARG